MSGVGPAGGGPAGGGRGADGADSAGVPWAGRTLTPQPFAGDDGSADPGLERALSEWARGGSLTAVVHAWVPSRALVPVVAIGPEGSPAAAGGGDKEADMAVALLTGRDGSRALPAFTSVGALSAWDPVARPVPVEAARAAQAAVAEGCTALVLDPAGPVTCVLPRPAVWAVAQGRVWSRPCDDPDVSAAVHAAVDAVVRGAGVPTVQGMAVHPEGDAGLRLVLTLTPGLTAADVAALTDGIGDALAGNPLVAERVHAVRLSIQPAGSTR